jgi:hypothetical protein
MRHLRIVIAETNGGKGTGRKDRDPYETIAEVGPEKRGHDNGNHDEQASHGWSARFFLVSFGAFLADVLANLKIAEASNYKGTNNESSEQSSQAGKSGAEGDVAKDAKGRDVVLELKEQQPIEQLASDTAAVSRHVEILLRSASVREALPALRMQTYKRAEVAIRSLRALVTFRLPDFQRLFQLHAAGRLQEHDITVSALTHEPRSRFFRCSEEFGVYTCLARAVYHCFG